MRHEDADLNRVLKEDGVSLVDAFEQINLASTSLREVKAKMGAPPWAVRVVYNPLFGGVLICQNPGEGNRLHYHPDADECWVIMEGEWEWYIEGKGSMKVQKDDIVVVERGKRHKITAIGTQPAIRFAITRPDVNHVYADEE
jgi:mannose-6-phosphate isomerase-like protein (cupin superfamily)